MNRVNYEKTGKILESESLNVAGRAVMWYRVKSNNGKTYLTGFVIFGRPRLRSVSC